MIRRAYDLGVTFFDTAPTYGDAEELVAVPIFQSLLELRDGAGEDAAKDMDHIRQELKTILSAKLLPRSR